jgi:Ca2+-binding EF-hand superfamily protein
MMVLVKNSNEIVDRLALFIQNNNINFYQIISEFDLEGNGFITQEDLKFALKKLQFNLSSGEFNNLLRSLNIENVELISVKDFVRNFV